MEVSSFVGLRRILSPQGSAPWKYFLPNFGTVSDGVVSRLYIKLPAATLCFRCH